ncbi:MAG: PaaI family thioesterase [Dehalococcoidia bacterium]
MPDEPRPPSWTDEGRAAGFDDAWHEEWWRRMEESGGNVIASYRMRMVEVSDDHVVMSVPYQPAARQGTGVFAAGVLIQVADVAATSACFEWMRRKEPDLAELPFPLSVQISVSLLRNTDHGSVITETRLIHGGRRLMVAESLIKDEDGRLLATMTSTHLVARQ